MEHERLAVSRPVSGPAEPSAPGRIPGRPPAVAPGPDRRGRSPGSPSERGPGRPGSTFLYGSSRELVNVLLFAAAREGNRTVHWLDIRTSREPTPALDPTALGWIDEDHLWTVDPAEALAPAPDRAGAALFEVVRKDEPPETLARLTDFLRLPARIQRILAEPPTEGAPRAIAVANADRARGAFPAATLPPILEAVAGAGYALLVGFDGPPPGGRHLFDTVVRVDGASVRRWTEATLVVERGRPWPGTPGGTRRPLPELPFAAEALRRATDAL